MSIDKEISDAIKKHLPEQVGDALKSELSRLENLEKENATLARTAEKLQERHNELCQKVTELEAEKKQWQSDLQWREELRFEARQLSIGQQVLEVEQRCAQEKVQLVKDCFKLVFGNRAVRETVQKSVPVEGMIYDSYKGQSVPGTRLEPTTETKTTEEV